MVNLTVKPTKRYTQNPLLIDSHTPCAFSAASRPVPAGHDA
jgi:hypothetical protein